MLALCVGLDLDIQSFFDQIDSKLLMRAVRKHTDCPWVLLYIERWLQAPVQMEDGSLVARERGTPQAGVVSPIFVEFLRITRSTSGCSGTIRPSR